MTGREDGAAGLLQGKVAVVTGGGSGLGAATAKVLARNGATVVISGRRLDALEAQAAHIRAANGVAVPVQSDVSKPEQVRALVEGAIETYGGIDILVNNAGRHGQFIIAHEVALEDFDDIIATNLRGPFLMAQAAIPSMLARGGGAIVNISSMAGIVGLKYCVSYSAAKAGLVNMTRTLALDYGDKGIRVNCICPGGMGPTESHDRIPPEELARAFEATRPGSPIATPAHVDDVAELVLFLVGPHGIAMTGAVIPFDGGYTAR